MWAKQGSVSLKEQEGMRGRRWPAVDVSVTTERVRYTSGMRQCRLWNINEAAESHRVAETEA